MTSLLYHSGDKYKCSKGSVSFWLGKGFFSSYDDMEIIRVEGGREEQKGVNFNLEVTVDSYI